MTGSRQASPKRGAEGDGHAPVSGLAEQIKALGSSHSAEASPERTAQRRDSGVEPVTARILRKAGEQATVDGADEQQIHGDGNWQRRLADQSLKPDQVREPA